MAKRVYRSTRDRMLGGVCGGLAEYFDIDPTIMRLLWVLLALAHGFGILAYIVAWIIIPERPQGEVPHEEAPHKAPHESTGPDACPGTGEAPAAEDQRPDSGSQFLAIILIIIGAWFLIVNIWPWIRVERFWPVVLIVAGLFLLLGGRRQGR
ncbi:MAG TPA: PspC domain-containing protein [Firmicutes bacterium]|nr:PspC domain-containing protein [Bacillota bacterium]